jgi:putative addiction module component (TIGR02574 family)
LALSLPEINMPNLEEVRSERARALSPGDRARLAEHLLESLPDETGSETAVAWDQEIGRRVEQLKSGMAPLTPAKDVHAEARRIYG